MPSLKDSIRTVLRRLESIRYGYTTKDKAKILIIQILRSLPMFFGKTRRDPLVSLIRSYSKVIVKRYGFKLALVDWDSFRLFFKN